MSKFLENRITENNINLLSSIFKFDFKTEELKLDCSTVYFYKKAQITFAYAKVMS